MLTPEQLANRKKGIGGSDVWAILGKSKYKTPLDVYNEKIGEAVPSKTNEQMMWGNILEPSILKGYAQRTGYEVSTPDTIHDREHPFLFANIDGWVESEKLVVEIKNSSRFDIWGDEGTNQIPLQYLCQVAHYCSITGAKGADIAVLLNGHKLNIFSYKRNEALEKKIREKCIDFWVNYVEKRVPPQFVDVKEQIEVLYKHAQDTIITADEEKIKLYEEIFSLKDEKKKLDKQLKDIEMQIKMAMGNNSCLTDEKGNVLVTWKNQKSRFFDVEKLRSDRPDIYDQYAKLKEYRRLNVKQVKELVA